MPFATPKADAASDAVSWVPSLLPFSTGNRFVDAGISAMMILAVAAGLAYLIVMAVGGFRARRMLRL